MAKQGLVKQHKVISSGRLIGSGRGTAGKKKVQGRCPVPVDPCYSLYSTDSEDQVTTIHKGLDRCAALLNGILKTEKTEAKSSRSKPERPAPSKAKSKLAPGKGEVVRKKPLRRICSIAPSDTRSAVQKKILSSQAFPAVQEQHCVHALETPFGRPVPAPGAKPSSGSRPGAGHQAHIQSSPPITELKNPPLFNCWLTTSTPASSADGANNSVPSEPCVLNSALCQRCSSREDYTPLKSDRLACSGPAAVGSLCEEPMWGTRLTPQSPVPDSQGSALRWPEGPASLRALCDPVQLQRSVPDMGAHGGGELQPAASGETSEYSEGSSTEDDELDCVDVTPVRDMGCQSGLEKHQPPPQEKSLSPEKTAKKVLTVRGLLGELKALVVSKADCEALRLIAEVEQSINLLPSLVAGSNIQAEIALAVQPLRNENVQLRRRLRIVNQQLMERERMEREARPADCNFELISLQSVNLSLQSQLKEAQRDIEALQKRNKDLQQENGKLWKDAEDKQRELHESRQQCELDIIRIKMDVDAALSEMKSYQFKLQESQEENNLLKLHLQQKEAEINRLKELTRHLPDNQSGLSEFHRENYAFNPTSHLSKTVLDLFEDKQKVACLLDPASDPVHVYLKTLDTSGQVPLDHGYSSDKPSTRSEWDSRGTVKLPEGDHPPKHRGIGATENKLFNFTLCKVPELEKTSYIPLKETKKVQQSVSPPKLLESKNTMLNGQEPKISSHSLEKLHLYKNHLSGRAALDDADCDFPITNLAVTHPSRSKNVTPLSEQQHLVPPKNVSVSTLDSTTLSYEDKSMVSNCSSSSWTTFNTQDELDFRSGLRIPAALHRINRYRKLMDG
ncbi:coiled-coil domain-containing protein 14 isoform X2 [Brienomyrus brachyistius]|uniref:coiled-coil domain-containing protein 14 isoform X2 n=1 Tax=Brienomyrus brachyistius TaxID=42636 RepID=UPI0020B2D9CC|nr:coiled-coil domain-containing protein 14 isoform X2 [Brienomyrus brachyistius]